MPFTSSPSNSGILTELLNTVITTLLESQRFASESFAEPMTTALLQIVVFFIAVRQLGGFNLWDVVFGAGWALALGVFVQHFPEIAVMFRDDLVFIGERGLGAPGRSLIMNPSAIMDLGFQSTENLTTNPTINALEIFGTALGLSYSFILTLAYLVMTWTCMIATTQWYIVLIIATTLVPFVVAPPLRFLADRGVQVLVGSSVWMMACSIGLTLVQPVLEKLKVGQDAPAHDLMIITAGVGYCATLVAFVPVVLGMLSMGGSSEILSAAIRAASTAVATWQRAASAAARAA